MQCVHDMAQIKHIVSLSQNYGYCDKGTDCTRSHDVHLVLDQEESLVQQREESKKKRRKRKREGQHMPTQDLLGQFVSELEQARKTLSKNGSPTMTDDSEHHQTREQTGPESRALTTKSTGSSKPTSSIIITPHKAGVDAFMTGFCFACYVLRLAASSGEVMGVASFPKLLESVGDMANKIALGGKPVPLLVTKSVYSSTSACHRAYQACS